VVKPVILKFNVNQTVMPSYDIIEMVPLVFLHLSWCCIEFQAIELPSFCPNDFFYSKHRKEGEEDWEVFARVIRELMHSEGDLRYCDDRLRDKILYEAYMQKNHKKEKDFLEMLDRRRKEAAGDECNQIEQLDKEDPIDDIESNKPPEAPAENDAPTPYLQDREYEEFGQLG
jgi:hypothetical protein